MQQRSPVPYVLPLSGALLIILGAFGPWVKVLEITEGGLDSDGALTIFLGLAALGFIGWAWMKERTPPRVILGIIGLLALLIAIIDVADVLGTDLGQLSPSVGWGLWLTLVGAIDLVISVVFLQMVVGRQATG